MAAISWVFFNKSGLNTENRPSAGALTAPTLPSIARRDSEAESGADHVASHLASARVPPHSEQSISPHSCKSDGITWP
jgi:hypothetical protein